MKISQLMLAKGFGGGERLFVDLVTLLVEKGHDVLAICQAGSEVETILKNNPDINIGSVKAFSTRDPFAWRAIARKIKQHDSDVVQSHMSRATYMAGKACRQLSKPLVVTLHNYIDLKYYTNVTRFIPATRDQYDYLHRKNIPEHMIDLIPHFSYLDPVAAPSFNDNESLLFGCYGRMVNKKGFHLVLPAFKKLLEAGVKASLVIGGDGPELSNLENLSAQLKLQDDVKFIGWVDDVAEFLETADVFVLPSLDEPFGIAVLEAMAMGKPIVSSKSQGPKEILNNENAYLAELNDVGSLFRAMLSAAKDKPEREDKARQALVDYKTFYDKEVVLPKFLNLYEKVATKIK